MKFGKNLERVVNIADPEWAPYWPNYKMLKKVIKGITPSHPGLVRSNSNNSNSTAATATSFTQQQQQASSNQQDSSHESSSSRRDLDGHVEPQQHQQQHQQQHRQSEGDDTSEQKQSMGESSVANTTAEARPTGTSTGVSTSTSQAVAQHQYSAVNNNNNNSNASNNNSNTASAVTARTVASLGTNPGEVAFFKLLHAEVKKATHFFSQAQQEYAIREERVRNGMDVMAAQTKEYGSYATEDRWPRLAQSIFRLYRELLLLETFCIMAYCGFSKILKKHDKLTGHSTKNAFMAKIVNQANFVNYPRVLAMITRCERLYEDVSQRLVQEGQQQLYEDERLFIHMIHRLNQQCVMPGTANTGSSSTRSPSLSAAAAAAHAVPPLVPLSSSSLSSSKKTEASPTTDQSRKLIELVAEIEEDKTAAAATTTAKKVDDGDDRKKEGSTIPKNIKSENLTDGAATSTTTATSTSTSSSEKRKASMVSDDNPGDETDSRKRQHVEMKASSD